MSATAIIIICIGLAAITAPIVIRRRRRAAAVARAVAEAVAGKWTVAQYAGDIEPKADAMHFFDNGVGCDIIGGRMVTFAYRATSKKRITITQYTRKRSYKLKIRPQELILTRPGECIILHRD